MKKYCLWLIAALIISLYSPVNEAQAQAVPHDFLIDDRPGENTLGMRLVTYFRENGKVRDGAIFLDETFEELRESSISNLNRLLSFVDHEALEHAKISDWITATPNIEKGKTESPCPATYCVILLEMNDRIFTLRYEVDKSDNAVFGGDIILGNHEFLQRSNVREILKIAASTNTDGVNSIGIKSWLEQGRALSNQIGIGARASFNSASIKWKDKTVPYKLADGLPMETVTQFNLAVAVWNKQVDSLKFRKCDATCVLPKTYLKVSEYFGDNCKANYGSAKNGNENPKMSLNKNKCHAGKILHELFHVAGFIHEHQREDREEYIYPDNLNGIPIYVDPIESGSLSQPYDPCSISHYKAKSASQPIFTSKGRTLLDSCKGHFGSGTDLKFPGQREKLSKGDIEAVNQLYN